MAQIDSSTENKGCKKTLFALFWMNIANEPMIALYSLAPFILRKELSTSLLWISFFTTLRPMLTVFSSYWNSLLPYKKNKLLDYLTHSYFLAYVPFLLLPFIPSAGFFFVACTLYQLFYRASTPALIEILKQKLPKNIREQAVSWGFMISFGISCLFGGTLGKLLDKGYVDWKVIFFLSAAIGLTSIFFQKRISLPRQESLAVPLLKERIVLPWKQSYQLMTERPDFAIFQWGFMIGGFSLMLMAPALSLYYVDVLSLSYIEMSSARFLFMGIGILASSYFWKKGLAEDRINHYMRGILVGFGLFPAFLYLAQLHLNWLYAAFFLYGISQAGSHLIWSLSGTVFSKEKESYLFTNVNLLMLGLRGIIAPLLGGILCKWFGPNPVLFFSSILCFVGFAVTTYLLVRQAKMQGKAARPI